MLLVNKTEAYNTRIGTRLGGAGLTKSPPLWGRGHSTPPWNPPPVNSPNSKALYTKTYVFQNLFMHLLTEYATELIVPALDIN